MKFKDIDFAAGVATDWINDRGYNVPCRAVTVWSHADAEHDWVLVSGDWHGQWAEVECIPFIPMTYVEPWDAIDSDKFAEMSRKELDDKLIYTDQGVDLGSHMLKMEKEWLEYEQESRVM